MEQNTAAQRPRTRIRVGHTHTQRGGWQHETTVEIEWLGDEITDDDGAATRLEQLLHLADELGREESARRNRDTAAPAPAPARPAARNTTASAA